MLYKNRSTSNVADRFIEPGRRSFEEMHRGPRLPGDLLRGTIVEKEVPRVPETDGGDVDPRNLSPFQGCQDIPPRKKPRDRNAFPHEKVGNGKRNKRCARLSGKILKKIEYVGTGRKAAYHRAPRIRPFPPLSPEEGARLVHKLPQQPHPVADLRERPVRAAPGDLLSRPSAEATAQPGKEG